MSVEQKVEVPIIIPVQGCITHTSLPSKIKHIKNSKFLDNSWDPVEQKYIKEVWKHKVTKLGKEKYDLVWQYYKNRGKNSVSNIYKLNYQQQLRITYFDDCVQHTVQVDKDKIQVAKMFDKLILEKYKLVTKKEKLLLDHTDKEDNYEESYLVSKKIEKRADVKYKLVVKKERAKSKNYIKKDITTPAKAPSK